jgi:hypothetical protein
MLDPINDDDLLILFKTSGTKINEIVEYANQLNLEKNGNKVTFVKNQKY